VFAALSLGACMAPVLLTAEPRFRAAVLIAGGYQPKPFMLEAEPRRHAPHVKLPVLMIGGLLDEVYPLETSQMPLYRHLGSADKQIKHFESGHIPPVDETVKFVDEWLAFRTRPGKEPGSNATDPEKALRNAIVFYRKLAVERPDDPKVFEELSRS